MRVLAGRDFKVKYKQSVLGPLWLVFQPLALLAAFIVAFQGLGGVETSGFPYAVFALVGLTVWSFFQAAMTIGTASVVTNANYVRYTPCPRPAFPWPRSSPRFRRLRSRRPAPSWPRRSAAIFPRKSLLLPLGLLWLVALTLGIVAVSSALTVRYRDILSALPFLLQVGLFLAPVGYPLADLSPAVRAIVDLNPVTGVIEGFRWMLLSGYEPSFEPVGCVAPGDGVACRGRLAIFSRRETTMADEI